MFYVNVRLQPSEYAALTRTVPSAANAFSVHRNADGEAIRCGVISLAEIAGMLAQVDTCSLPLSAVPSALLGAIHQLTERASRVAHNELARREAFEPVMVRTRGFHELAPGVIVPTRVDDDIPF